MTNQVADLKLDNDFLPQGSGRGEPHDFKVTPHRTLKSKPLIDSK